MKSFVEWMRAQSETAWTYNVIRSWRFHSAVSISLAKPTSSSCYSHQSNKPQILEVHLPNIPHTTPISKATLVALNWKCHCDEILVTGYTGCYINAPSQQKFRHWLHLALSKCHFDDIFFTGCTESCHFDNFRCSQWRNFPQNNDISIPM